MPWLQNGTATTNAGNTTSTVTVPSGVTADQWCLFTLGNANGPGSVGTASISSSNGSAVFQNWFNVADLNNTALTAYVGTKLVSGDTVTITTTQNSTARMSHFYFSTPLASVGTLGTRGGVSQTTVAAPSMSVIPGSTVYALASIRSATTADSLSSVVNSNGDTVTQLYSNYVGTTNPAVDVNLYSFLEPTSSTGTTTFTDSVATGNAGAFHFAEASSASVAWL